MQWFTPEKKTLRLVWLYNITGIFSQNKKYGRKKVKIKNMAEKNKSEQSGYYTWD